MGLGIVMVAVELAKRSRKRRRTAGWALGSEGLGG